MSVDIKQTVNSAFRSLKNLQKQTIKSEFKRFVNVYKCEDDATQPGVSKRKTLQAAIERFLDCVQSIDSLAAMSYALSFQPQ